jgi:hypothetical protein
MALPTTTSVTSRWIPARPATSGLATLDPAEQVKNQAKLFWVEGIKENA